MDIVMGKLKASRIFTEDEFDVLCRYESDLDNGKVYGVGINEYMQDETEENWNRSWVLVGETYTEAQSKVDRWKMILCAITLACNRDHMWSALEVARIASTMTGDLQEGGLRE